jgi:hypothetical protein
MNIVFHWQAIFMATLVGVIVSAIWYSPLVFHKLWQQLSGLSDERLKQGFGLSLGLAVLGSLATALCLDGFFNFTGSNSFAMGAMAGLQLFLGLVLPAMVTEHAFGRRPWPLLALNLGPVAINAIVMGGLIASMR